MFSYNELNSCDYLFTTACHNTKLTVAWCIAVPMTVVQVIACTARYDVAASHLQVPCCASVTAHKQNDWLQVKSVGRDRCVMELMQLLVKSPHTVGQSTRMLVLDCLI